MEKLLEKLVEKKFVIKNCEENNMVKLNHHHQWTMGFWKGRHNFLIVRQGL
jgi:hypothetical protein